MNQITTEQKVMIAEEVEFDEILRELSRYGTANVWFSQGKWVSKILLADVDVGVECSIKSQSDVFDTPIEAARQCLERVRAYVGVKR